MEKEFWRLNAHYEGIKRVQCKKNENSLRPSDGAWMRNKTDDHCKGWQWSCCCWDQIQVGSSLSWEIKWFKWCNWFSMAKWFSGTMTYGLWNGLWFGHAFFTIRRWRLHDITNLDLKIQLHKTWDIIMIYKTIKL